MVVLFDLSKAFDVINHKIVLHKLNTCGIRGIANDWLESYLSNRTQFVEIDDIVVVLPSGENFPVYSSGGSTFPPVPI